MPKVVILTEELYPWFVVTHDTETIENEFFADSVVTLSDQELAEIKKAAATFHEWQSRLGRMLKRSGEAESNH